MIGGHNTIDSLKEACSEPGGDGSLQYEDRYDDDKFFIEIYPDEYYIEELDTGAEITFNFPETVQTLLKMYERRKARKKENVNT